MPSHRLHKRLAAEYLGLPKSIVAEVDRAIDLGPLHDAGRRLPKNPPAYLDIVEGGDVEKLFRIRKSRRVRELLRSMFSDTLKAQAFYFHHGLDILAMRKASANILELDSARSCPLIVDGVVFDLSFIEARLRSTDVRPLPLKAFEDRIKDALLRSCHDSGLDEWVNSVIVPRYRRYLRIDALEEELLRAVAKALRSAGKYEAGILLGQLAFIRGEAVAR